MQKIVLIPCVSKKLNVRAKAKELYISSLFRYMFAYANSLHPDKIFILSAKHGLVNPEQTIEPYEMTLNKMKDSEIKSWSERVLGALSKEADLNNDEFIILAGEKYRRYLLPSLKHYSAPLSNLGIGKQLQFLKSKVKNV